MKVKINDEICEANAYCVRECPEVFAVDDEDNVSLLMPEVGSELMDKVKAAVRLCPRQALSIEE